MLGTEPGAFRRLLLTVELSLTLLKKKKIQICILCSWGSNPGPLAHQIKIINTSPNKLYAIPCNVFLSLSLCVCICIYYTYRNGILERLKDLPKIVKLVTFGPGIRTWALLTPELVPRYHIAKCQAYTLLANEPGCLVRPHLRLNSVKGGPS